MSNFAIQYQLNLGMEEMAIIHACNISDDHTYKVYHHANHVPLGWIPVGTVEFCEGVYNQSFTPDYYPKFLSKHLHRRVWVSKDWDQSRGIFVKPADRYKRFDGFVTLGGYRRKKRGPYWFSERINFLSEWRYYIANGKVLTSEWYESPIEKDAPPIDHIDIPSNYCGAIDFGETDEGKFALVEAQHPYAIGWYAKDSKAYLKFILEGYKYLQNLPIMKTN